MNKNIIYLAGKVPKSDSINFVDWRKECMRVLGEVKYSYVSPLDSRAEEDDSFAVFGQCNSNIKDSDIVLIYASSKLGVGTSQEMLIAKYFGKCVITYLPKGTPHRKENIVLTGKNIKDWIHPFIYECSDAIITSYDDLEDAILKLSKQKIKDISIIDKSILHYKKNLSK